VERSTPSGAAALELLDRAVEVRQVDGRDRREPLLVGVQLVEKQVVRHAQRRAALLRLANRELTPSEATGVHELVVDADCVAPLQPAVDVVGAEGRGHGVHIAAECLAHLGRRQLVDRWPLVARHLVEDLAGDRLHDLPDPVGGMAADPVELGGFPVAVDIDDDHDAPLDVQVDVLDVQELGETETAPLAAVAALLDATEGGSR
jgi:hypothetical protein